MAPAGPVRVVLVTTRVGCVLDTVTLPVGDTGVGALMTTGVVVPLRRSVSVPPTLPKQVVPE